MLNLARLLVALSALLTLCAGLPMPSWSLWLVRYVAIEARPLTLLFGVVGALLAWHAGARGAAAIGLASAVLTAVPVARAISVARDVEAPISITAWLTGYWPPQVQVQRDVLLDPASPDLLVDIYRGGRPWVLVIHGGSWQHGDKGECGHVSRALADAGFTVFDLRYRLAPMHPFPEGPSNVLCAFGQLRAQAERFGIDPERGALLGRSAGAHLALLAGHANGALEPSCPVSTAPPAAVISLYGPVDLAWGHDHPFSPDVVDGPQSIRTFLGGYPGERPETYALASPHTHVSATSPPTLLLHGLAERVVRPIHARFFADAMLAAGRPVQVIEIPGAEHGFDARPGGLGEQIARGAILRFLREQLSVER